MSRPRCENGEAEWTRVPTNATSNLKLETRHATRPHETHEVTTREVTSLDTTLSFMALSPL